MPGIDKRIPFLTIRRILRAGLSRRVTRHIEATPGTEVSRICVRNGEVVIVSVEEMPQAHAATALRTAIHAVAR
jgi:hypothetical protein